LGHATILSHTLLGCLPDSIFTKLPFILKDQHGC
jgi:hypothetical protein